MKGTDILKDGRCIKHGKTWMQCHECMDLYRDVSSKEWINRQIELKRAGDFIRAQKAHNNSMLDLNHNEDYKYIDRYL